MSEFKILVDGELTTVVPLDELEAIRSQLRQFRAVLTQETLITVISKARWEFAELYLGGKQPTTQEWSQLVACAILAIPEVAAIVKP